MLRELHAVRPYLPFICACQKDPRFSDPMLATQQQMQRNLLDAPDDPANKVFGVFDGESLIGLFVFLVVEPERYMELLAGLSGSAAAYDELFAYLRAAYPGYQADFVFNPQNILLRQALATLHAAFEPEQQKLVLRTPAAYVPDSRVRRCTPELQAQYLALHTADRYWTGEKVLGAPEIFRVLLVVEDGEVAGYLDLTYGSPENEPYDLFVREKSRRKGLARALLAEAIEQNRPNAMMLLVDIDNTAALALYESMGFVRVSGENNLTASVRLPDRCAVVQR